MPDDALGYAVHVYVSYGRGGAADCVYVVGRLSDGRSFAAADRAWRPTAYVAASDADRASASLPSGQGFEPSSLAALDGSPLAGWRAPSFAVYRDAADRLSRAGILVHGGGSLPDMYRADRALGGGVRVRGESRPGRRVAVVFPDAVVEACDSAVAPLVVLSLDIETDESDSSLRAVSLKSASWDHFSGRLRAADGPAEVLLLDPGCRASGEDGRYSLVSAPDEASLLRLARDRVVAMDPDVVCGWNVVDFDMARLVERAEANGLSFDIGRSSDGARVLPKGKGRTATAVVPGRQVLDAMRVARSGPERYDDYALETVARAVLGRGKGLSERGGAKLEALDRLFEADLPGFAAYAAEDASLVVDVLDASGLFALTMGRARLVGLGLDRAWTSVAAFERAYGASLLAMSVAAPPFEEGRSVSGAAGGTVLPAAAGCRDGVAVLDFRSLYPSVMRTFNVDPLSYARSGFPDDIVAPNGAAFARARGPLPALVDRYFALREEAQASGDATASYVYKILMNSFYGVLGTSSCRYARTELAGAITSFGRLVLLRAKAVIEEAGYEVLYGDTDSLFVDTRLGARAPFGAYRERAEALCALVNDELSRFADEEYGLASRLELRFDKAYARFVIPPLRYAGPRASANADEGALDGPDGGGGEDADEKADVVAALGAAGGADMVDDLDTAGSGAASRGRGKGYAGLRRAEGGDSIDVKGMEAARSDSTPLARAFQLRLLSLAFMEDADEAALGRYIGGLVASLRKGELDAELVYRRALRRPAASYVKNTPPHVRAARLAGLSGRGRVSYVMTKDGPAPVDEASYGRGPRLPGEPVPDYGHYVDRQLLPIARSLADSGLPVPLSALSGGLEPGQLELF